MATISAYLVMEAIIMASPLMEPSLSRVTELLMNMKIAEYPMLKSALMKNDIVTSTNHKTSLLLHAQGTETCQCVQ